MSTHHANAKYPPLPTAFGWRAMCPNGHGVNGGLARGIANHTNHITAYRRKVWGVKSLPLWDAGAAASAIPTGLSGTNDLFYFGGHTGHGVEYLEAYFILAKDTSELGTNPLVYISAYDVAAATTAVSNTFQYGASPSGASDTPDEYAYGRVTVAVTSNKEYQITVKAQDYARVIACTLYEIGLTPVDTTDGGIDPSPGIGVNVLDSHLEAVLPAQTNLWRHNAGVVLQWTRDTLALAPSTTSTTYNNIIDAGTTVSASSPGLRVNLQYHNTVSQTAVPVRMMVRAVLTAGPSGTGSVRVTDGTNSLEVTGIDASTNWYSVTGTMPATDAQKWDLQSKAPTGGTVRVDAIYVYEWQS